MHECSTSDPILSADNWQALFQEYPTLLLCKLHRKSVACLEILRALWKPPTVYRKSSVEQLSKSSAVYSQSSISVIHLRFFRIDLCGQQQAHQFARQAPHRVIAMAVVSRSISSLTHRLIICLFSPQCLHKSRQMICTLPNVAQLAIALQHLFRDVSNWIQTPLIYPPNLQLHLWSTHWIAVHWNSSQCPSLMHYWRSCKNNFQ